jgi:thiamine biosynthesis lipoprotein
MPVVLDLREPGRNDVADRVFDLLRWVDATFSTYKEASEVSRIARGELPVAAACPEVRSVLRRCEELRLETRGYFDAYATGALDPSGLVKGWSIDRAADLLDSEGVLNYGLSAGGDMRLRGAAVPDDRWRVGIQHPLLRGAVAAVVEATDLAIATSGAYARGDHVVDPHTGRPPGAVLSVTVTGPELAAADAYATAAFAMDAAGPHWTARLPRGYEAMTILADETVLSTAGFPSVGPVPAPSGAAGEAVARPRFSGDSQQLVSR